jgi:hypothetical protein
MVAVDMFALLLGSSGYFVELPDFDVDGAVATSSEAFSCHIDGVPSVTTIMT